MQCCEQRKGHNVDEANSDNRCADDVIWTRTPGQHETAFVLCAVYAHCSYTGWYEAKTKITVIFSTFGINNHLCLSFSLNVAEPCWKLTRMPPEWTLWFESNDIRPYRHRSCLFTRTISSTKKHSTPSGKWLTSISSAHESGQQSQITLPVNHTWQHVDLAQAILWKLFNLASDWILMVF